MRGIVIISIASVLASCKAQQPALVNKNTEVKEFKSDSSTASIKDSTSFVYLRETTPESKNKINTTVTIDSTGIVPFNITVTSGTDTLHLRGKGNQLLAESNCAKKERILLQKLRELEKKQSLTSSRQKHEKQTEVIVSVVTHEVTPWWNWLGYGVLGSVIVLLLFNNIRNSFKI